MIFVAMLGTLFDTPTMIVHEFRAWLRGRRDRETVAVIADSLGATPIAVWQWLMGRRHPSLQVLKLATLLQGDVARWSRELEPGLPSLPLMPRGPYQPRKAKSAIVRIKSSP